MLFSEAIKKFNVWKGFKVGQGTLNGYDLYLRHFSIFLKNPHIENITIEQILEWLNLMKEMDFNIATIEKKVIALRKFFEFFKKQNYNVVDPWIIPLPPKRAVMPRVATEEDYRKLLNVIPKETEYYWHIRNLAMINMLWDSGARIGEIIALNVSDLDFNRNRAVIRTEKSKGMRPFREIFWTKPTTANLKRWIDKREEIIIDMEIARVEIEEADALFIGIKGGHCGLGARGKRLTANAASEVLRKYSNMAGLKISLNPHSMRHHFGHELAKKGANNSMISNLLGHSSLQSSYRYTQLYDTELEEVYKKFTE